MKCFTDRFRMLAAWPFLVVGTPFLLLARKIGGEGVRHALVDTLRLRSDHGY